MNQQPWPGKRDSIAAWADLSAPFLGFKTLKEGAKGSHKINYF
jgi:hypothetical protein